jgi:Tfp pilus assembly protein PilO
MSPSLWRRIFQERRTILLPLAALVLANVGVLILGVLPLRQSVAGLRDERRTAAFDLNLAKLLEKQARNARESKERADVELKKFYADVLPGDFSSARRLVAMQFLANTANEAGLTFERGQAEPVDLRDSQLQRVTAKVTLRGDYSNIRKFLYAVETAPEFVIIERVALAQASNQQSNRSEALDVTLDVATYYLSDAVSRR